ncbi:MAG: M14 family metallopeptidase [Ilumatobacteraceae bacterium]
MDDRFDRYLRHDDLTAWLHDLSVQYPGLVEVESYGRSHEGRDLWLVTVTDQSTGPHHTKPAHWVDASIHAVELTATVAACSLLRRLVTGFASDEVVTRALRTRTFYVVPRVNPDGAEWVLADQPRFRRSSVRAWPWRDGHRWPGLQSEDIDGDGRILQMRVADPAGGWTSHPEDVRLMVPVPPEGPSEGSSTYRLLQEGSVSDHDGFTIGTPRPVEGLDLNRNFPAGWGTNIPGSGDHPLSEPEIDALVRAIVARPNICGFNAYHTSGGVLLRPSSTRPDAKLAPADVWVWKQLAEQGTALTGYPSHSVFEDFTWDQSETMSGASDDWAYEHLGIFGWTTEFWDVVHAATGVKQSTHSWYTGPTDTEALAVLRWCDEHHPAGHVDWYPFDHPQLGAIELGGWDDLSTWTNPPLHLLHDEVAPHADFAIHQALCSPVLAIPHVVATPLGEHLWQLDIGVANVGWLPTDVTALARAGHLVKPLTVSVAGDGVEVVDGPTRRQCGQLEGRAALRFLGGNDGTADRVLTRWVIRAPGGVTVTIEAIHDRCGRSCVEYRLP